MIAITPAAAVHLRALLSAHAGAPSNEPPASGQVTSEEVKKTGMAGVPEGLRILVEKGGCAGMQYAMKLDVPREGDLLSEAEGARVFMDPASAALLRGAELDYCDDLVGTGFRLQNPNAARSCGCGTSFEPAQPEVEPAQPEAEQHSTPQESAASFAR
jgi:iron-sulfur cluster assembly protein